MISRLVIVTFVASFLVFSAKSTCADVVYDEAASGDLSDDQFSPTPIATQLGSNMILGQLNESGTDPDFWTIVISPGQLLASITLFDYTNERSFFAIEAGTQITDTGTGVGLLGGVVFNNPGSMVGDDLLDDLGSGSIGSGFTPPLGPGTYTFWLQEQSNGGATIDYGFDFSVVPEPTSILIGFGMMMGIGLRRRR